MKEEFALTENNINMTAILKEVDGIVKKHGKMRESILFGALCIPHVLREEGDIWNNNAFSIELIERIEVKFKEIWIELTLKKWAKRKILDMFLSQWRFIFPKDKRIKSVFIFKEYFADSFRLFRFYSNLAGLYDDYLIFWDKARKHPEVMDEFLDAFSRGENLNDENLLINAKKQSPKKSKWKNFHRRKKKKA